MTKNNDNIINPFWWHFYALQASLWLLYGIVFRLIFLGYEYLTTSSLWIFLYVIGGFLFSNILGFLYYKLKEQALNIQLPFAIIASTFLGVFWRFLLNYFQFHYLNSEPPEDLSFFGYIIGGMTSVIHLLAWSVGYLLIAYYLKFRKEQEKTILAELLAKEAQIKQLHQQISPHFLFNVLHSLDTLMIKGDLKKGRKMISDLSDYLRTTIYPTPDFSLPLEVELRNARSYLDIEQMRFGNKLEVNWDIDEKTETLKVPSLILQPLLENSIKHCINKSLHGGKINIKTLVKENSVEIVVSNKSNGPCINEEAKNLGLGLENLRERLEIFYDGKANLKTFQEDNGTFSSKIEIGLNND